MQNDTTTTAFVQMDPAILAELLIEVKETLASDINFKILVAKKQKFNIVDLWNVRSKFRTASSMRKHR
jgi:hypothetical protein